MSTPVNRLRRTVVVRPRRLFPSTFAPMRQRFRMLRSYIIETARRAAILLLTCAEEIFYVDDVMPHPTTTVCDEYITPTAVICNILSVIQNQNWWSTLFSERISIMVEQAITNPKSIQSQSYTKMHTLFSSSPSGDHTFDVVRKSMRAEVISAANVAETEKNQDYDRKHVLSSTLLEKYHGDTVNLIKTAQKLLTEVEVAMNSPY
uniref:Wsv419-like protein n=1 Tax=Penaeus monodon endogenous nimavirus TaxID=2133795 RepID=A0A401IPI5_9VIRU|nr:wsv419-like protein [Penaeus monodon endogenous nimavirus]